MPSTQIIEHLHCVRAHRYLLERVLNKLQVQTKHLREAGPHSSGRQENRTKKRMSPVTFALPCNHVSPFPSDLCVLLCMPGQRKKKRFSLSTAPGARVAPSHFIISSEQQNLVLLKPLYNKSTIRNHLLHNQKKSWALCL